MKDEERPKVDIDYTLDWSEIAEQWRLAYFKLDRFAIDTSFKYELWKMVAVYGWMCVISILLAKFIS